LDRIRLVRRYALESELNEFIGALDVAKSNVEPDDLKVMFKNHATIFAKSYAGKEWKTSVSFRFFSVKKSPAIAIDFTPSKLSEEDWADFLSLLAVMFPGGSQQVWTQFKVAKLEVAVDLKVPFNDLVCLAPKVSKVDVQYVKRGTLYLGHENGRRHYCIYDKRKQLVETGGGDPGYAMSRVEVKLRPSGMLLQQINEIKRPFGNLLVLRKSQLSVLKKKNPLSIELDVFAKAIAKGATAQWAYLELDSYSRKLLLTLLRPPALKLNGSVLRWGAWISMQQQALEARFLKECHPAA
jgi:hypothetical protein